MTVGTHREPAHTNTIKVCAITHFGYPVQKLNQALTLIESLESPTNTLRSLGYTKLQMRGDNQPTKECRNMGREDHLMT